MQRSTIAGLTVVAITMIITLFSPSRDASTASATPSHADVATTNPRLSDATLLASEHDGLRIVTRGGARHISPAGLPMRSSYYTIVADPNTPRRAYAINGDIYQTDDAGTSWTQLHPPRSDLSPAGFTALAIDPHTSLVYAAGTRVVVYNPATRTWYTWGNGWAGSVPPSHIVPTGDGTVYAAAANRLYQARGVHGRWERASPSAWGGAPITGLALGPDGETLFVVVNSTDIWYLDHGVFPLDAIGLPSSTTVHALQADPEGGDLYAATDAGLFVRHQPGSTGSDQGWLRVTVAGHMPIVDVHPIEHGAGMLALARSGTIVDGQHSPRGQSLTWQCCSVRGAVTDAIAAVVGREWQGAPAPAPLPAAFTHTCLPDGPTPTEAFDICGPFRTFYLTYGKSFIFGFPRGRAVNGPNGSVIQTFGKARLRWTPSRGVALDAVGRQLAGGRVFPLPTQQEAARAVEAGSVYIGGYYVDPRFYRFWRSYLDAAGASIFGPPISQALMEPSSDGSGRRVLVQYFVNARLEYHPNGPGATVELSYVGG